MNLKQSLICAIALCVLGTVAWELYWRSQGYYPDLDNDEALFAAQRKRADKASNSDVILIGSSRIHFDIQLDVWKKETGIKPIQLAYPGATPLPVFHDLVHKTDFSGTIVVGVTPGLFFSSTTTEKRAYRSANDKVEYFHDQTYAQQLNHILSIPLQQNLAFMSDADGIDAMKLQFLLEGIQFGNRIEGSDFPPFPNFADISLDRNLRMTEKTVTDTAFARLIKNVWSFKSTPETPPRELDKEGVMKIFVADAKAFQDRGGNLVLLRCPSTEYYRKKEENFYCRDEFWDELVKQSGAKGYHFEDYAQLKDLDCPEWSHLSGEDADFFTAEVAKIMMNDNSIPFNLKTN
ncbi:hypothetical protein [Hanstruepera ponticola]|uniref:hypothetical protein n=1 Tax=Hanstruepera ponticola TaxID=2042995 RepID=UPI000CF159A5|nr:hypothetical protein [Hanstruepera ponticola]